MAQPYVGEIIMFGGNFQIVFREQRFQLPRIQRIGGRRKDFDGIEAVLGRFGATGGEVVRKHKRPAAHFRDECDRDGGAHLSGMLTSETAVRSNEVAGEGPICCEGFIGSRYCGRVAGGSQSRCQ